MSAALELVLRATLLIGAAWGAAAMLRKARASAAARHMAWLLGIAALLALPFLWWLAPPMHLPILAPETASGAVTTFLPPAGAAPPAAAAARGWGAIILAIYLIGVAALVLRFALSRRLVSRLWRDAAPAADKGWQDLLARAAGEMEVSRPVQLRIARGPALPMTWGPMTWGTLAPGILLPAEAQVWPANRRRLVLLHELAHVARRDSLSRSTAALVCALYWFHPGAWFAARRLRLEQECAADDRVLNAGAPARSYARNLLDLAARVGGKAWPDHAAAMAGMCQLERRVMSITGPARREQPGLPFLSAAVAIGTCVMLATATALPVRPAPTLPEQPGSETALPSAPAEASPEPAMQRADRAATAPPVETRPREPRNDPAGQPLDREAPTPIMASQQTTPVAPPEPTLAPANSQNAPATPQRVVYGPQWSQPLPAEQESDPRLPSAFRGSRPRSVDQRAGPGPPRNAGEQLLRTLPTAILERAGALPPG